MIVVGEGLTENTGVGAGSFGTVEADGAIAVDGPSLFIWGTLLILSIVSVMLFAERHLEGGVTAFAGQASALPGTQAEREASCPGHRAHRDLPADDVRRRRHDALQLPPTTS